jgi:hypothetical protein
LGPFFIGREQATCVACVEELKRAAIFLFVRRQNKNGERRAAKIFRQENYL